MKRIEFIAPVESMRGSFSPKQTLLYAENNNPAYEAPIGRQYARNYSPIFVGAKRASSGLKYFAAKTKSATLISPASKLRMALLGAAGAIYAVITRNPESADYAKLYAWYEAKLAQGVRGSLRKLASDHIMTEINRHSPSIIFTTGGGPTVPFGILNPWNGEGESAGYEISSDVLVKFWLQLAPNALVFTVDGQVGIAKSGQSFSNICATEARAYMNVLGLESATGDYVTLDGKNIVLGEVFIEEADEIVANGRYLTTDETPE